MCSLVCKFNYMGHESQIPEGEPQVLVLISGEILLIEQFLFHCNKVIINYWYVSSLLHWLFHPIRIETLILRTCTHVLLPQLHIITLSFDWFTGFTVSFLISKARVITLVLVLSNPIENKLYSVHICSSGSRNGWVDSFLEAIGLDDLVNTNYSKMGKAGLC